MYWFIVCHQLLENWLIGPNDINEENHIHICKLWLKK